MNNKTLPIPVPQSQLQEFKRLSVLFFENLTTESNQFYSKKDGPKKRHGYDLFSQGFGYKNHSQLCIAAKGNKGDKPLSITIRDNLSLIEHNLKNGLKNYRQKSYIGSIPLTIAFDTSCIDKILCRLAPKVVTNTASMFSILTGPKLNAQLWYKKEEYLAVANIHKAALEWDVSTFAHEVMKVNWTKELIEKEKYILYYSLQFDLIDVFDYFLSLGYEFEQSYYQECLEFAINKGYQKACIELIKRGANVEHKLKYYYKDSSKCVIHKILDGELVQVLQYLIDSNKLGFNGYMYYLINFLGPCFLLLESISTDKERLDCIHNIINKGGQQYCLAYLLENNKHLIEQIDTSNVFESYTSDNNENIMLILPVLLLYKVGLDCSVMLNKVLDIAEGGDLHMKHRAYCLVGMLYEGDSNTIDIGRLKEENNKLSNGRAMTLDALIAIKQD